MVKKGLMAMAVVIVGLLFLTGPIIAQENNEEAKKKLNQVRSELQKLKYGYQQEVQNTNKMYDGKLAVIKEEFHKTRDKCLEERNNKLAVMQLGYKQKISPIVQEEKKLLEVLGPADGSNFVMTKRDREARK